MHAFMTTVFWPSTTDAAAGLATIGAHLMLSGKVSWIPAFARMTISEVSATKTVIPMKMGIQETLPIHACAKGSKAQGKEKSAFMHENGKPALS